MDRKGQATLTIGIILMTFVTILVGVILFQAIAQEAGKTSATAVYNTTAGSDAITAPAQGASIDLEGQELLGSVIVRNDTYIIAADNYTVTEGVSTTTGVKTILFTTSATGTIAGQSLNISYPYGADGYVTSSGARGVIGIIAIFFALAIAIVALVPTLRSGVLQGFGR
jgi:hypothetical protein|tara:strand:+ start:964 stop:1470 length:507 start_codon:yes stop_codon:yes gene_type:complete